MARTSDQTLEYRIGGMDCASCAATIRTALERMPGVSDLNISVQSERLSLRLAPEGTSRERVEGAIASLGYSASALSEPAEHDHDHDHEGHEHGAESELDEDGRTVMSVGGMDCASCAVSIRSALETMPGVSDVRVSVPRERLSLVLTPGSSTTEEEIRATITRLGYTPGGPGAAKDDKTAAAWWQQPKLRQLLVSALIVALAYAVSLAMPALHHWAFGLATLLAVWPIAWRAVAAARLGAARLRFRQRWAVLAAANIYGAIGRKVLDRGQLAWDRRVVVPGYEKAWHVLTAFGQAIANRSEGPDEPIIWTRHDYRPVAGW